MMCAYFELCFRRVGGVETFLLLQEKQFLGLSSTARATVMTATNSWADRS